MTHIYQVVPTIKRGYGVKRSDGMIATFNFQNTARSIARDLEAGRRRESDFFWRGPEVEMMEDEE